MHEIHDAAEANDCRVIRALLASNPELVRDRNELDDEPLHTACLQKHIDSAILLLQHGADVNSQGDWGRTALHYAVHDANRDSIPLVKLLLESGADPAIKMEQGMSVLMYAKREQYEGYDEVATLLKSGDLAGDGR